MPKTRTRVNLHKNSKNGKIRKTRKNPQQKHIGAKRLKGGTVLGEGSFGCVLHPHIKCDKIKVDSRDKTISKIISFPNDDEMEKELSMSNRIKKLDPQMNHFITFYGSCKIRRLQEDRPDIERVEFSDKDHYDSLEDPKTLKKKDKYRCLIDTNLEPQNILMPYGGIELDSILHDKDENSQYAHINAIIMGDLKHYLKTSLEGLKLIHYNKIAHRDIKPGNIVCLLNESNNTVKMRYIDLGLATKIYDYFDYNDILLDGTVNYMGPEIIVAYYVLEYSYLVDNRPKTVLKYIYDEYWDKGEKRDNYIRTMEKCGLTSRIKSYRADFERMVKDFKNKYYEDTLIDSYFGFKNVKNSYLMKSDIYSLGVVFAKMCNYYNKMNLAETAPKLWDLLVKMVEFNPDKRFNIDECLAHPYFKATDTKA